MLMKKQIVVCALSVLIALVLAVDAPAEELAKNGGFEIGDTSDWTSFGFGTQTFAVTSVVNTGSFAGELFNDIEARRWWSSRPIWESAT